jgi:ABC-type lipoprotein release transport system permease subunit
MRKPLTTFIGGVIVGAGLVLTAGYMAGFERPLQHQAVSTVAQVQPLPPTGWEDFLAVERRIPKHLEQCVSIRVAADSQRSTRAWQREQTLALERAVAACVAMQKAPDTLARK